MFVAIKYNVMQNMVLNDKFKQFRKIIEKRSRSIVVQSSMIASFKCGYKSHFLPYSKEVLVLKLNIMLKDNNKNN
jgi:hypothetical protein